MLVMPGCEMTLCQLQMRQLEGFSVHTCLTGRLKPPVGTVPSPVMSTGVPTNLQVTSLMNALHSLPDDLLGVLAVGRGALWVLFQAGLPPGWCLFSRLQV